MSEKLKLNNTYDLTKNITGLEINTGFILGLDAILMHYIANIIEDPTTLPQTFQKFEDIITGKHTDENPVELDLFERHMYTLFAIQQLLKAKAHEQGLEVPLETEATKEDLQEYMDATLNNDLEKAAKKLKEIQDMTVTETGEKLS